MTTATTHTPGPWTNQRKGREAFICGSAVHVASVPLEDEQDEANARLIAAAPEMREALAAMLATHDRRHALPDACEEAANETDPDHLNLDCVEAMTVRALLDQIEGR